MRHSLDCLSPSSFFSIGALFIPNFVYSAVQVVSAFLYHTDGHVLLVFWLLPEVILLTFHLFLPTNFLFRYLNTLFSIHCM